MSSLIAPGASRPHLTVFLNPEGPEVFHSVCHRHDIWKQDPFDVPSIHREARETFESLVEQATTPPGTTAGRILLLLGESGAGKTHLMRAFRSHVHGNNLGYCAYMQMTASTNNYGRYVLSNVIDSLDRPYSEPLLEASGLTCLSKDLVDSLPQALDAVRTLRDIELNLSSQQLGDLTHELTDRLLDDPRFKELDHNLLRALLYLQRDDARVKRRVLAYLRCEDLATYDRNVLGGIIPRTDDDAPQRTVEQLGTLMWALRQACLVILVDQLEDIYNLDQAEQKFRRAMSTVCDLHDRVPSSIIVISCLEDFYEKLKNCLAEPQRFRLEKDPDSMRLIAERSEQEVFDLVAQRLDWLYEDCIELPPGEDRLYPFPPHELRELTGTKTRHVLDWCRTFRGRCMQSGEMVGTESTEPREEEPPQSPPVVEMEQAWNDFRASYEATVPDSEEELAQVLSRALQQSGGEVEYARLAVQRDTRVVRVEVQAPDAPARKVLAAICNNNAQGGSLARQIRELAGRADGYCLVAVRSADFPSNPKTQVAKLLGEFITAGGRRVTVEDAEWRAMLAFAAYGQKHSGDSAFAAWQRQERPLTQLKSLQVILDLDHLTMPQRHKAAAQSAQPAEPVAVADAQPQLPLNAAVAAASALLIAGVSLDRHQAEVTLACQDMSRHAAFLGGTGSGKTTLALNLVEQLLACGVPAVLFDRKGDLCGYADEVWWNTDEGDTALRERKQRLRAKVDVVLYTPGNPSGRALAIRVVPSGMPEMAEFDRAKISRFAAAALGGMMGYGVTHSTEKYIAILTQAIRILGSSSDSLVTVNSLISMIAEHDPELVAAIGYLDRKHFRRVAEDLQALAINRGELLGSGGDQLDVDALLGRAGHASPGRTRLSIVSTKFMGDNSDIEFWITQLLLEVSRWASQHPSDKPQAVLLFDEADMYLPATRKPATKGPMEDLLKRGRSAGICTFLATQSPGDLDYKCRDNIRSWFVGRVKECTAIEKLKPSFAHDAGNLEARLASQAMGEFFFVCEGKDTQLRAHRSLLKTRQYSEDEILHLARNDAAAK